MTLVSTGFCFHFLPIFPDIEFNFTFGKVPCRAFFETGALCACSSQYTPFCLLHSAPRMVGGMLLVSLSRRYILYIPRTARPNYPSASSQNIPKIQTLGQEYSPFLWFFPLLRYPLSITMSTVALMHVSKSSTQSKRQSWDGRNS
jgi:hypothetical protein